MVDDDAEVIEGVEADDDGADEDLTNDIQQFMQSMKNKNLDEVI